MMIVSLCLFTNWKLLSTATLCFCFDFDAFTGTLRTHKCTTICVQSLSKIFNIKYSHLTFFMVIMCVMCMWVTLLLAVSIAYSLCPLHSHDQCTTNINYSYIHKHIHNLALKFVFSDIKISLASSDMLAAHEHTVNLLSEYAVHRHSMGRIVRYGANF